MNALYFENGKHTAKKINLLLSVDLGKESKQGRCYQNSIQAMQTMDNRDAYYVEGYAIFYNENIYNLWHHGWVELNGEIIDNYPGIWKRFEVIYFPGKRYTFQQALAIQKKQPFAFYWKSLFFAIKAYHSSMKPERFPAGLWNPLWFTTAAKLALAYGMSK